MGDERERRRRKTWRIVLRSLIVRLLQLVAVSDLMVSR